MPQIILEVSDSVEREISAKALAAGLLPDEYLLRLAQLASAPVEVDPNSLSFEEWQENIRQMDEFLATIPSLQQPKEVDDSRESIY